MGRRRPCLYKGRTISFLILANPFYVRQCRTFHKYRICFYCAGLSATGKTVSDNKECALLQALQTDGVQVRTYIHYLPVLSFFKIQCRFIGNLFNAFLET